MRVVSVIIPAYNEKNNIRRCLESLMKQTFTKMEIIVINDGSTDETEKIVKLFRGVKLLNFPKRMGKTHALNKGIRHSKGQFLLFLDADTELFPDAIEKIISYRRAIMGRLLYVDGSFIKEKFRFYAQKGVGEACFFLNKKWFLDNVGEYKTGGGKNYEVVERVTNIIMWNKMKRPLLTNECVGYTKVPDSVWFGLKSAFRASRRDVKLFSRGVRYPADVKEGGIRDTIKSLLFPLFFPLLPFYFVKDAVRFWRYTHNSVYALFFPFYLTVQFGVAFVGTLRGLLDCL